MNLYQLAVEPHSSFRTLPANLTLHTIKFMSGGLYLFGRKTETDFGPSLSVKCPRCNNETYLHFVYRKTWVEVWFIVFIKLFPYRRRHYLTCRICSSSWELKESEIGAAKRLAEAKKGTPDEYKAVLAEESRELTSMLR